MILLIGDSNYRNLLDTYGEALSAAGKTSLNIRVVVVIA